MVGRTAHAVVEFIGGVQPLRRQTLQDGVGGVAGLEREGVLGAVTRAEALGLDLLVGLGDRDGLAGGVVDGHALPEGRAAPAHADHLVEVLPAREGVVGRVDVDQAAALEDVLGERVLHVGAPFRAVVVVHDHGVVGELGRPLAPGVRVGLVEGGLFFLPGLERGVVSLLAVGVARLGLGRLGLGERGRGGRDVDLEAAGGLEGGLAGLGRADPVVVVATVDDQDLDGVGRGERQGQEGEQAEEPERFQGFHGEGPHWKRNLPVCERFQPRSRER